MTNTEFKNTLDLPSGTEFKGHIKDHGDVEGKIEVDKNGDRFWLCFEEGPIGDVSPDMHGYLNSWIMTPNNLGTLQKFEVLNKEPKIIDNYEIY